MPFVNLTRATLRRAEFGFFGVVVYTLMHTPRRCGDRISAGLLVFPLVSFRACLINWLIVGIPSPLWTVQSVLLILSPALAASRHPARLAWITPAPPLFLLPQRRYRDIRSNPSRRESACPQSRFL